MIIKKGDLYFVSYYNSSTRRGRPAVVVSGNEINRTKDAVTVAYLSAKPIGGVGRTHARLTSSGRESYAIVECVTTLPKHRLGDYIGHITLEEGVAIDSALCVAFDL